MALHLFPLLCLHPDDEGIVAGSFDIKHPHKNYNQRYGLLCPKRTKRGWATDSLSGLSRFWWRGQRKERGRDNWGGGGDNFCLQPRPVLYQSFKTYLLLVLWIWGEFVVCCKKDFGGEY